MLYSGEIIDNTYKIVNEIGSGGMGVVYLAFHLRLEKYVVMKKFKGDVSNVSLLRNEVDILKSLHHPYLPQVYDFIEFENDIYTIIDYINGYDLSYYIKNGEFFSENQLVKWLKQLCEVLVYLHEKPVPVIHMDIKPANIIVNSDGNICLIDFGISLGQSETIKGFSVNYSSPEQYHNVLSILNGSYDEMVELDGRSDIYSLGATFYYLMTGILPDIENQEQPDISQFDIPYSDAFVSIIQKSMNKNLSDRFKTARKMLDAVNNIKKQDKRFKKYVAIQICVSSIAVLSAISGIGLMINGNNSIIKDNFNKDYEKFVESYEQNDYSATDEGRRILDNDNYQKYIDNETKENLLHSVGDCYYRQNDFVNASVYYKKAYEAAGSTKNNNENADVYFRDYLISLIMNNDLSKVENEIDKAENKDSYYIRIVEAQFNLYIGNTDNCREILNEILSQNIGIENEYMGYLIYGDSFFKEKDYLNAVKYYEQALNVKKDISVLRKLGSAYFNCMVYVDSNNRQYIEKSLEYYTEIQNDYYPSVTDTINLAQIYRFTDNYTEAENVLKRLSDYYPQDCRVYIYLAFTSYDKNSSEVSMYCRKAHELFITATDDVKSSIPDDDLIEIKKMYSYYCSSEW